MVYNSNCPFKRWSGTGTNLFMFGVKSGPRKYGPYVFEKFIGFGNSFITKRYILMSRRGQDLWDGRI